MLATDTCCSSEFNKFFVYSGNNFNSIHLVSLSVRAKAGQPKLYRSAAWRWRHADVRGRALNHDAFL